MVRTDLPTRKLPRNGVVGNRLGWASALLLTTWVGRLDRSYLLIGDRNGRTAMPLFAYEIEFRRRRVAIQTGLFQRSIEHFVSSVLNRGAVRRDLQSKKLPAVGVWKGCAIMLYHCLCRDQLQNCAGRILLIGHAVLKYSDGFPERDRDSESACFSLSAGRGGSRSSFRLSQDHQPKGLRPDRDTKRVGRCSAFFQFKPS